MVSEASITPGKINKSAMPMAMGSPNAPMALTDIVTSFQTKHVITLTSLMLCSCALAFFHNVNVNVNIRFI